MKSITSNKKKNLIIFFIFGFIYYAIEVAYRGYSHPTMFLVGGLCGVLIGLLNENKKCSEIPIVYQMLLGAIIITLIELVFGCIFNIWLGLGIWNYSNMPFNILGQVCLPFSIAWFFLSYVAIILDDYLRKKIE